MTKHPTEQPPNSPNSDPGDGKGGPPNSPFSNPNAQRIWIILALGVVLMLLIMLGNRTPFSSSNTISLSELAVAIENQQVDTLLVRGGSEILIEYKDGKNATSYKDPFTDLYDILERAGVPRTAMDSDNLTYVEQPGDNTSSILLQIIIGVVPILIIVWFLWRMMRSVRVGQDQAMNFGRSRAKVSRDMERPQVKFTDVAGAEESKEELQEVVEFLKEPDKFLQLGARVPSGVLMVGPPGTGKTLMARAVAGEAGVPFFRVSGSEFVEMFVGVGASRVRDLFDRAKAEAPAIIFIDEIDAVGRQRGAGLGGGHDEREQTLNQILVEMDGFETDTNLIVIAATNRPDILDPALLRPGRFDRKVMMDNPDIKGRQQILKVHARGKPFGEDVDLEAIARITPGFSGADLENLINEAAILTARRSKKHVGMSELQEAMERVVMGPERRSRVFSEKEKEYIAYHEGGHAIVGHMLENSDPIHKITIVARGRAGGYVMNLPQSDNQGLKTQQAFEDEIAMAMGGRAAEEIVFDEITAGASSDLRQATSLARQMVTQFGMSDKLGPRTYGEARGSIFLGRELGEQRDYSEQYAEEIDNEVRRILQTAHQRAKNILIEQRDKLEELVNVLMEKETLDSEEFYAIMNSGDQLAPSTIDVDVE